ncbi:DDE_3 domain-containing protein [Trichonephila clavipes]|nr:DDE_3 domain-containing protein [Trichonephila clavipes]
MNGNHFEKWFETDLPKLKPQNIIVMDNAPYHSVKKEKIPISSLEKSAIQEWLSEKKVTWNQDLIKIKLLQKMLHWEHAAFYVDAESVDHNLLRMRVRNQRIKSDFVSSVYKSVRRDEVSTKSTLYRR